MSKSKILIKMSGSIAGYKACYLISRLKQEGFDIQVVATESTLKFIGPATLEGLTGRPVICDTFASGHAMDHIYLNRWADLIIAIPATANFINKIAQGIGDDLVSTLFLAHDFKKPYLLAPAMNTAMYLHPATQNSLKQLNSMGIKILETASGVLACGEVGWGKLLDPELIYQEILKELENPSPATTEAKVNPASAKKILVTSGGTQEPIDQMRVMTNLSTGATGAIIADHLHALGFDVTYLHAQSAQMPKSSIVAQSFTSFSDLDQTLRTLLEVQSFDYVVHAAAVSDFTLESISQNDINIPINTQGKISSSSPLTLRFKPNFKIIERLKSYSRNKTIKIVGFKFTSTLDSEMRQNAAEKLFSAEGVDLVIHNDSHDIERKFGTHKFTLYSNDKIKPCESKEEMLQGLDQFLFGGLQ